MKRNWAWLAGALVAVPAMVAAIAFADARFELGVLHSTWQTEVVLFGAVSVGLYLLWRLKLRARWQHVVLMLAYAPAMFAFLAWLSLVIQFKFDDCMTQQPVSRRVGLDQRSSTSLCEQRITVANMRQDLE